MRSRLFILAANTQIIDFHDFLAAMSSSRSDVVTQFMFSCVHPLFFLLVSMESVVHLKCHRASTSVKGTQL